MKTIVHHLERARSYRNDGGFTLIELLITIVIVGMITASTVAAFSLSIKTSTSANDRIKKSNTAQFISRFLVPDAASAGGFNERNEAVTESGLTPGVWIQTSTPGGFCDVAGSIVRFEWVERAPAVKRVASNYSIVGTNLTRTFCTQSVPAAGAPAISSVVLGTNINTAEATCVGADPCGPGLVEPDPYLIVTLKVTSTSSPANQYEFSVSGFVRAGGTTPTATAATVPLIALGVPGAPCPTHRGGSGSSPTAQVPASGVAVAARKTTSSPGNPADPFEPKITVFGIAAINSNATTSSPCGQAGNISAPTGWFATQTLVGSGGTCNNCGTTIPIAAPLIDPYAGMTPPPYNCASGPNQPANSVVGNERRFQPGTYRTQLNLVISGGADQYIFAPGVYVFCNGVRIQSGILAQSQPGGVLFYFAGGSMRRIIPGPGGGDDFSDINFQIDGRPEYRDVVIWQPNPTTTDGNTTGDLEIPIGENDPIAHPLSARYGGVIYAPNAQVEFYLPTRETLGQYETVEATAAGVVARNIVADRISRIRLGDGPQTTTTLVPTPDPPTVGQPVTLRATVTPVYPATGVATGVVTFLDDNDQLGTMPLVNGVATLVTSALGGGPRPLKAIYSGDLVFASSVSPTRDTVFNQAPSTTTLVSNPNPAGAGQPITMSATVAGVGAGPVPTGSVIFYDGALALGSVTLDAVGQAELTTTLSEGLHSLRAVYTQDASYLGSTSNVVDQIVKQGSTVLVTSTPNPSNAGQAVTLRAEVRSVIPGTIATGTVTFFDTGNVQIGAGNIALDANGDATLVVSNLVGGPHNITARYSGDTPLAPSTSPVHGHTVNFQSGTVGLVSNVNPSVFGASVTFTATVTGTPGLPLTGSTITFRTGSVAGPIIGGPTAVNGAGVATMSTTSLPLGTITVFAMFSGNANYAPASTSLTQVVQAGTLTALTSNRQPSADWGQTVTFTATVTESPAGTGAPIGNVNFYVDGSLIGQVALSGTTAALTTSATFFDVGTHPITAVFVPTAGNYTSSTSTVLNQIVNLATTTMNLTSSLNPASPNQPFTISVTVTAATPAPPSGTVYFYDNNVFFGQANVVGGTATFTTAFAEVRNHPITAYFPATGNFQASTYFTLNQGVQLISTSMVVTSNLNPATPGATVTLRADITAGAPNPTGTVFFYDNNVFLGSGNVGGGFAVLLVNGFSAGTHPITAYFVGTGNFADSSYFTLNQVVGTVATNLVVTSNVNPSTPGQAVTLTGTVTSATGSPTGTVFFYDNQVFIGQGTVNAGVATFTTSSLAAGTHPITGLFQGTGGYQDSTFFTLNQVVASATATAVTSSLNPAFVAQSVTFTATVTSATGTPTGNVTFFDGATSLGVRTLNASGVATLATTTLAIGPHSITAVYAGTPSFVTSTSPVLTQVIQAATVTAVASNRQPSAQWGQTVTFTATVTESPVSAGAPIGNVNFYDNGSLIAQIPLSGTTAAFTTTATALSVGTHPITAAFAPTGGNFTGSTSPVLNQVVNLATTTLTVTSNLNPSGPGQQFTLTATVSSAAPVPANGTVFFYDNNVNFGSATLVNGVATLNWSFATLGTHPITAFYPATGNFQASSFFTLNQAVS